MSPLGCKVEADLMNARVQGHNAEQNGDTREALGPEMRCADSWPWGGGRAPGGGVGTDVQGADTLGSKAEDSLPKAGTELGVGSPAVLPGVQLPPKPRAVPKPQPDAQLNQSVSKKSCICNIKRYSY